MTIKCDKWIKRNIDSGNLIIDPFIPDSINQINGKKVPSFGLSSYGYDIRLGNNFKVAKCSTFNNPSNVFNLFSEQNQIQEYKKPFVDILDFDKDLFLEVNNVSEIIIEPLSFVLGHSLEKISIPKNVSAVCMGKSTIARSGLHVIVTPLEPGWSGYVTLEIFNSLRVPIKLYPGIGITQVQFFESDENCEISYSDRDGKYQNQPALPIAPIN